MCFFNYLSLATNAITLFFVQVFNFLLRLIFVFLCSTLVVFLYTAIFIVFPRFFKDEDDRYLEIKASQEKAFDKQVEFFYGTFSFLLTKK